MREEVVLAPRVGKAEAIDHEGAPLYPFDLLVLRRHGAPTAFPTFTLSKVEGHACLIRKMMTVKGI